MTQERELPPLRVRLLGDDASFRQMVARTHRTMAALDKAVQRAGGLGAGSAAAAAGIKTATTTAMELVERRILYGIQQLVGKVHKATVKPAAINRAMRDAMTVVATAIANGIRRAVSSAANVKSSPTNARKVFKQAIDLLQWTLAVAIRRMVATAANVKSSPTYARRVMAQALDVLRHTLLIAIRRMVATAATIQGQPSQVMKAMRSAIKTLMYTVSQVVTRIAISANATLSSGNVPYVATTATAFRKIIKNTVTALTQMVSMTMTMAVLRVNYAQLATSLSRTLQKDLRNLANSISSKMMAATQGSRARSFGTTGGRAAGRSRADGGFGLGSRADIYMHANALQNIFQSGGGIIDMAAQLRDAEVMIETFTGSAQKAAVIMEDIKQFAAATPFSRLGLAKAAQSMMSYGVATNEVMPLLKQIGEISGGNQERFALLSYAISQIVSQTKLMGQELKQLTEHAFNPLATISEITGIEYGKLKKQMEDGTVSAQHVKDALRAATSEGGRHAGKLNKLSKELGGLINQVREGVMNMALDIFRVLEGDIKRGLNALLNILQKIQDYLNTDAGKKAMVFYANLAKNVFISIAAFHSLGLAIALTRWQLSNVMMLFHVLRVVIAPVVFLISALSTAFSILQATISVAMLVASGSFAAAATAGMALVANVGGILLGVVAVATAMSFLRDKIAGAGGIKGAIENMVATMQWMAGASIGFFYNIKENAAIVAEWMAASFEEIFGQSVSQTLSDLESQFTGFSDNILGGLMKTWAVLDITINTTMGMVRQAFADIISLVRQLTEGGFFGLENFLPDFKGMEEVSQMLQAMEEDTRARELKNKENVMGAWDMLMDPNSAQKLKDNVAAAADAVSKIKGPKGLKLERPALDFAPPPDLPTAPAFNPDFSGLGQGAVGKGAAKVDAAVRRGSSEHAVQAYQHMRNLSAVQASGKAGKQDLQKEQLQVSIEMRNAMRSIDKKINPQAGQQQMAALDPTAKGF